MRSLIDAGEAAEERTRLDEMSRTRDRFRGAAAAARSPLQSAVAERYLILCSIALNRPDAARAAWSRLVGAATSAVFDAHAKRRSANAIAERQLRERGEKTRAAARRGTCGKRATR